MGKFCDFAVPEDGDAVFIHGVNVHLPGMLMSVLGMLKSLPRQLLAGLMILFLMGVCGTAVGVGGTIVQLSGSLMILVVRSVVITSRHL
jgi:hypothetical protein